VKALRGPLLSVRDLRVHYATEVGIVRAVDGVWFEVNEGERVCIVGESGSGKTTVALAIMGLLPRNALVRGEIVYKGRDLLKLSKEELRSIRGREISMVFQDPLTSLNPLLTIGVQCSEPYEEHLKLSRKEALQRAIDMLRKVKIPSPETSVRRYPHTFSGGMRQRTLIAMMTSLKPRLLIADEPFSALDVSLQVGLMQLLSELVRDFNSSLLLITHDLGVAAELCDRVIVMYAGKIVEEADIYTAFERSLHPYTQGLLKSLPTLERVITRSKLEVLRGLPPDLIKPPEGCRFHPRCPFATDVCRRDEPRLVEVERGHKVACWLRMGGIGGAT